MLEAAGITAYSGWRYLAMLPAAERAPRWSTGCRTWSAGCCSTAPPTPHGPVPSWRRPGCCRARPWPSAPPPRSRRTPSRPAWSSSCRPTRRWSTRTRPREVRAELSDATQARAAEIERLASGQDRDRELLGARAGLAGPPSDARRAGRRRRRRARPAGGHRRDRGQPPTTRWPTWTRGPRTWRPTGRAWPRPPPRRRSGRRRWPGWRPRPCGRPRCATASARRRPTPSAPTRRPRPPASGRRQAREDADAAAAPPGSAHGVAERARAELAELPLDRDDAVVGGTTTTAPAPRTGPQRAARCLRPGVAPPTRPPRWAPTSPRSWRWPSGTPAPRWVSSTR